MRYLDGFANISQNCYSVHLTLDVKITRRANSKLRTCSKISGIIRGVFTIALSDLQWGNASDGIRPDLLLGQKHVAVTPPPPSATLPAH